MIGGGCEAAGPDFGTQVPPSPSPPPPATPGPRPSPGSCRSAAPLPAPAGRRAPAVAGMKPAGKEGEMHVVELTSSRASLSPKQAKWGVKTRSAAVSDFICLSIDLFISVYIYAFMHTYTRLEAQLQLGSGSKSQTTGKSAASRGHGWAVFISDPPLTAPRAQTPLQRLDSSRAPCWTPGQAGPAPPARCRAATLH